MDGESECGMPTAIGYDGRKQRPAYRARPPGLQGLGRTSGLLSAPNLDDTPRFPQ